VSQTIGYARVSADDQNPRMQLDALKAAGCDPVFVEKASGALKDRPELAAALDYARPGDVLVVWKLDRLGRTLVDLVETVAGLEKRGIGFRSIEEGEFINTTTAAGELVFHIFASLAQFERRMILERAAAGRAAARARGETGGRPTVMTPEQLAAGRLLVGGGASIRQAARAIGVSKTTLGRHLGTEVSGQGFGTGKFAQVDGVLPLSRK
jgi:DNA invertase Pin-like site-specific DNA recombinase